MSAGPAAQSAIGREPRLREALELSIDRAVLNQVAFEVIGLAPMIHLLRLSLEALVFAPVLPQFGIGLAAGIIFDATVIRALLVPALVRMFGRWNWWLPQPVARVLRVPASPLWAGAAAAAGR